MQKKESFLVNRLKSVGFAFKGMLILIRTEASIKVQLFIAIVITIAGFYFDISKSEWMAQLIMIGIVMSMEGMNTAVEYIADFIHPEYHKKIGLIKDVAAGAVFIASIIAVIIAGIIYLPKFL
ncbi:diacylglycerol kinase family protein [uncultured Winogradskyella sp.]|jgi:diacylglycerol kinase (ATP)|uniref:diacylglycerol kinase family protein n=1 Tax=uncultured Winogradskyella sp. TaxID=395353 RepID=UPI0026054832|nr:diacylglycerol kinase family protein [uncultured Winogradskyella sp.]|tara:strand:+ start:18 stop:386 length:369 start_codon:yes stop_codon:yes gene_type:complete